jgi:hypothetical protein
METNPASDTARSNSTTPVTPVSSDDRIFYFWWDLSQGGHGFVELDGGGPDQGELDMPDVYRGPMDEPHRPKSKTSRCVFW